MQNTYCPFVNGHCVPNCKFAKKGIPSSIFGATYYCSIELAIQQTEEIYKKLNSIK